MSDAARYLAAKQPDLALAAADAALAESETAEGHDLRGRALNNLGRLEDAARAFQQAIELDRTSAQCHLHLGHVRNRLGQLDSAEQALRAALEHDPTLAAAWTLLGVLLTDTDRWAEAEACFGHARELVPEQVSPHINHGLALEREGLLHEADEAYAAAAALQPEDPEILVRMGLVALSLGNPTRAHALLADALKRDPDRTDAAAGIAAGFDVNGDFEQGLNWVETLTPAQRRAPDLILAETQLLLHMGRGERALDALERLCGDPAVDPSHRALAWFSRGEVLDRMDEVDAAWDAFVEGNLLQPKLFDPAAHERYVDALARRSRFRHPSSEASLRPVLIFGLPRSGSSLLEQMLSMHPAVAAGGERTMLGRLAAAARDADDRADGRSILELSQRVMADLVAVGQQAERTTDKMWQNFEYLDAARGLIPNASLVHIRRQPIDVAMSCFMQSFGFGGVPFSYDMEHIAQYIAGYRKVMAHWRDALDVDLIEVEYESLVSGTEETLRPLLQRIGLPWESRCLAPEASDRVVTTASNAQVRQAVNSGRIGRWERYRHRIPESWMALDQAGA
jgi:tetratricopeptide (TPR) repeat protein